MSHIIKNQEKKEKDDRYKTDNLALMSKANIYEKKINELKQERLNHKNELNNLRALKASSKNVLKFKLGEMEKKMKNEIYRLNEEVKRHEEAQKSENTKIQVHVNYIKENCEGLNQALKGKKIF